MRYRLLVVIAALFVAVSWAGVAVDAAITVSNGKDGAAVIKGAATYQNFENQANTPECVIWELSGQPQATFQKDLPHPWGTSGNVAFTYSNRFLSAAASDSIGSTTTWSPFFTNDLAPLNYLEVDITGSGITLEDPKLRLGRYTSGSGWTWTTTWYSPQDFVGPSTGTASWMILGANLASDQFDQFELSGTLRNLTGGGSVVLKTGYSTIPEPSSFALALLGGIPALAAIRLRCK